MRTRKTPNTESFHAVLVIFLVEFEKSLLIEGENTIHLVFLTSTKSNFYQNTVDTITILRRVFLNFINLIILIFKKF